MESSTPISVIKEYFDPQEIEAISNLGGAGGFSGANLWRITLLDGKKFCLRRWPSAEPDAERLEWIHRILTHGAVNGSTVLAYPIKTTMGKTFVSRAGHLWELSNWKPGTANFHDDPNESRLKAIMTAIAKVHLAFAQVQFDFGYSPGLQHRLDSLQNITAQISHVIASPPNSIDAVEKFRRCLCEPGFRSSFISLAGTARKRLERCQNTLLPIQPVIKDLWHDHVLFSDNEVTGIVDFGAMDMDSVAFDHSRLLGSLLGNDRTRWSEALQHYSMLRPLSDQETELVYAADLANIILSSLNWLNWILVERRVFENSEQVEQRINSIFQRLRQMFDTEF